MVGMSIPRFEADFTPCVEIGWRLGKKFWQRGLATEAAERCLDFASERGIAKSIFAFTPHQNTGSRKVMEKLGMIESHAFLHYGTEPHILYRLDL